MWDCLRSQDHNRVLITLQREKKLCCALNECSLPSSFCWLSHCIFRIMAWVSWDRSSMGRLQFSLVVSKVDSLTNNLSHQFSVTLSAREECPSQKSGRLCNSEATLTDGYLQFFTSNDTPNRFRSFPLPRQFIFQYHKLIRLIDYFHTLLTDSHK